MARKKKTRVSKIRDTADGLVDADRLAELLGVHRITVYNKAKVGAIPSYRVGRRIMFDYDEVKEALKA